MSISVQLAVALGEDLGALHLHPDKRKKLKKAQVGRGDGSLKGAGDKHGKGTPGEGFDVRHKTIPV